MSMLVLSILATHKHVHECCDCLPNTLKSLMAQHVRHTKHSMSACQTPDQRINKMQSFGTDLVTFSLKNKWNVWPPTANNPSHFYLASQTYESIVAVVAIVHESYRIFSKWKAPNSVHKHTVEQLAVGRQHILACSVGRSVSLERGERVEDNWQSRNWLTKWNSAAIRHTRMYLFMSSVVRKFISGFITANRHYPFVGWSGSQATSGSSQHLNITTSSNLKWLAAYSGLIGVRSEEEENKHAANWFVSLIPNQINAYSDDWIEFQRIAHTRYALRTNDLRYSLRRLG